MTDYVAPFARRLNELCGETPGVRRALASYLNCSQRLVDYWCSGEREPNLSQLALIRTFFNVDLDWLISGLELKVVQDRKLAKAIVGRCKAAMDEAVDELIKGA